MFITIAICTWNRAELLEKTLAQLCNMSIPEQVELEVLVVNNNSTDRTDDVINKYIKKLPLKKIFESKPGLSNARNAAVRNAAGEYILWTDDDVLVDQNWLKAYIRAFIKWPEASVFGGPIEPWFEGTPPKWLQRGWKYIAEAFAVRDLGGKSISLSVENKKLPYGANFAIRTAEQIHFLYDPNLGLKHGETILGEETKVISDILNAGFSGRWVPEARVKHWLPISRQTIKYLKTYYIGHGKTVNGLETNIDLKEIFGYPRWAIRKIFELYVSFFFKRVFFPPNIWLPVFIELNVLLGRLKYIRQQNKTKEIG